VLPLAEIPLRGRHNVANVLAAVTLADAVGVSPAAMAEAIRTFGGVEHRLERVATGDDVLWINDSIATAPERALAALAAFDEEIVLLAGGKDKDMVWDEWARRVAARAKAVILFGDLAEMLGERLAAVGYTRLHYTASLAEAVQMAGETAVPGDVVLLSPGGTSFDAFPDFAARGDAFRQLVEERQSGKATGDT
jgi:UDP-N-acetylmuramoylalanine--D-glutamate ligase